MAMAAHGQGFRQFMSVDIWGFTTHHYVEAVKILPGEEVQDMTSL